VGSHILGLQESRAPSAPSGLTVRGLHKTYGQDVQALHDVDLHAGEGEFVTLLGPSGSGKTTLLMLIGGFDTPTRGTIFQGSADITAVPPERRNFGVVFQNYALFPHMTVRRNVAYPLAARRVARAKREGRVKDALSLVGLEDMEDRRPAELSGGQQQRVALARALVYQPSVLLLDEPLGALDRSLRERMQTELQRLHKQTGVTFLYVTHDQEEALTMSDRIAVLRLGQIEQVGTPQDLYERPATEFVATFLGLANRFHCRVLQVRRGVAEIQLSFGARAAIPCADNTLRPGMAALVVVRPEELVIADSEAQDGLELQGSIEEVAFTGTIWRYRVRTREGVVQAHSICRLEAAAGDAIWIRWSARDSWAIPAGSAPAEPASP